MPKAENILGAVSRRCVWIGGARNNTACWLQVAVEDINLFWGALHKLGVLALDVARRRARPLHVVLPGEEKKQERGKTETESRRSFMSS